MCLAYEYMKIDRYLLVEEAKIKLVVVTEILKLTLLYDLFILDIISYIIYVHVYFYV